MLTKQKQELEQLSAQLNTIKDMAEKQERKAVEQHTAHSAGFSSDTFKNEKTRFTAIFPVHAGKLLGVSCICTKMHNVLDDHNTRHH